MTPNHLTGSHKSESCDSHETLPAPPRSAVLAFGDYDVIGEIGEGGMGRVYKAVDRNLGRFVAIKVLRSTDPFECGRFRGEAELIAMLDHPNIIKIFAIETTPDGRPYLVLEFVEGGSLDRELGGHPQEPRRAAEMTEVLARAVQVAHEKGVIHRDLKPANVLRGKDKALKLTDFGLAKELEVSSGMTPSGAVMGTPSYMAPEQAEGKVKQLGPVTDVYGLGAILYEMLTGRPPFRGVNMVDTLEQVRWAEPAPPSRLAPRLPRDLSTICLKCLQKSPGRRYQTAGELADDLRRWLNGETIAARPAPSWERLVRQVRRRPWEAATVAASALLVVLAVVGWVTLQRKEADDRLRDERAAAEAKIRDEKDANDRKLDKQKDEYAGQLKAHAERSLTALNQIRGLVLNNGLGKHAELGPLYKVLIKYYERLSEQQGGADYAVDLADGLLSVGELFLRTGDKTEGRNAYLKAEAICRPRAPTDEKAHRKLAEIRLKTARISFEMGDDGATEAACKEAEALWAGFPPTDLDATRRLAEVLHIKGEFFNRKRDFKKALENYREAIRLRRGLADEYLKRSPEEIARLEPETRTRVLEHLGDLGRGYGFRGDVQLASGQMVDADRDFWRSHQIREKVAEALRLHESGTLALDAQQQYARSWGNLTDMHTRTRALGTARYFARLSLDIQDKLVQADPINVEYKLDRWGRLNQIAELDLLLYDRTATGAGVKLLEPKDLPKDDTAGIGGSSRKARGILATAHLLRAAQAVQSKDLELLEARRAKEKVATEALPDLLAEVRRTLPDDVRQAAMTELRHAVLLFDDLCLDRSGVSVDSAHLYYKAAALTLLAELERRPPADPHWQSALDTLERAIELRYCGLHPDDVARFRAFVGLAKDERFKKLLAKLHS